MSSKPSQHVFSVYVFSVFDQTSMDTMNLKKKKKLRRMARTTEATGLIVFSPNSSLRNMVSTRVAYLNSKVHELSA
jgi:hypothetical protein